MKKIFLLFLILFTFLLASCEDSYGLREFIFRSNSVESRSDTLYSLPDVKPATGKVYAVLIITDVHFGGENSGNNGPRKDVQFLSWLKECWNPGIISEFCNLPWGCCRARHRF